MIALLTGRLVEKQATRLIVDVQGVGYEVQVPLSTFYSLPEPGGVVSLRIHTHVREDALQLFGFGTPLEQQLFERLIAISGIGPRLAISVLSGIDPADLVRAVQAGDVGRLTRIPGVGKKTAERIGLELKDRLPPQLTAELTAAGIPGSEASLRSDLVSALLNLGYHRPLAENAVDAALKRPGDRSFERMLKQALHELAR
ncbi:MAG TPA: Holliday junction branch migration protein RuvA [Vicinamibacterales bacterium]|jgi:Holliday junction DNA helicase RuvA